MRSSEDKKKLLVNIVGYSLIGILAFLTLTFTLGDRFFGMLTFLGLDRFRNDPGWMYVDCRKPENRDMKFCQPKESPADRSWKDIKRSGTDYVPFNLGQEKWER